MTLFAMVSFWGLVDTYNQHIASAPDQTLNRGINYFEAPNAQTTLADIQL